MAIPLDITLISARDLKDVNPLKKMSLYAVVSLSVDPNTRHRTPVAHACGKNPNWNHTVRLHVPEGEGVERSSIYLQVFILAKKTLVSDRDVGEVQISIRDLEARTASGPRVVTYPVKRSSGRAKGVVELSCNFGPVSAPAPPPALELAYPAPQPEVQQPQQRFVRRLVVGFLRVTTSVILTSLLSVATADVVESFNL